MENFSEHLTFRVSSTLAFKPTVQSCAYRELDEMISCLCSKYKATARRWLA